MNFIKNFWNFLNKPDLSDQERIDKWQKEVDEQDRLKELHRQSRKQEKKKNKTLSSNF